MDGAGTISGRWSLAAGRAGIKGCRICSGPTLPGTRLCTQCKAALKRARQETVSELIPPPSRSAARALARSRKAAAATGAASQRAVSGVRAWRGTALVLATIAAAAVGYAVLHFVRTGSPASTIARSEPVTARSEPAAPPAVAPTAPAQLPRAELATVQPAAAKDSAPPAIPAPPKAAAPRPAPKRVVETPPEPPPAPAVARFAAATEPPTPAPNPDPVPAPRSAPPRDRWQVMNDAVAQCGREGFFAGVVCEQRVRLQYCDGYWGQVPQCPSGIPNDHGD